MLTLRALLGSACTRPAALPEVLEAPPARQREFRGDGMSAACEHCGEAFQAGRAGWARPGPSCAIPASRHLPAAWPGSRRGFASSETLIHRELSRPAALPFWLPLPNPPVRRRLWMDQEQKGGK